jgi:hypothetical protein
MDATEGIFDSLFSHVDVLKAIATEKKKKRDDVCVCLCVRIHICRLMTIVPRSQAKRCGRHQNGIQA